MHDRGISRRKALEAVAVGGMAAAVLSLPGRPAAEGSEVALDKVPAAVKQAASRIFPKANWSVATKDKDETKGLSYALEGTIDNDVDVTVVVTVAGMVIEVTREIAVSEVAEKVMTAVAEKQPKFKATDAAEIRRGDNLQRADEGALFYELEGKDARGREVTIEVSAEGKITEVHTEISLKEVPKVVTAAVAVRMPKFKPRVVFEVRQDGEISSYALAGVRPRDKTEVVVVVSADGQQVDIDDD